MSSGNAILKVIPTFRSGIDDDLIDATIKNVSCYESDLELEVARVMEEILYYGFVHHTKSE